MPGLAGAARETTFDVEAFSADRPDTLHTIPAGDKSRVWTATSGSGAGGRPRPAGRLTNRPICPEPGSTRALAKDPVWKSVAARGEEGPEPSRERRGAGGAGHPGGAQECGPIRRCVLKGSGECTARDVHDWERDRSGGRVPLFFNREIRPETSVDGAAGYTPGHPS